MGIRVNPEVEVDSAHEYIATGDKEHKFGVPLDDALRVARLALTLPGVTLSGLQPYPLSNSSICPGKLSVSPALCVSV